MSEVIAMNAQVKQEITPAITIDDGSVDVPIQNQYGERIGVFRFNPTDLNIVNRYNQVADRFGEIGKLLVDASISPDGEGEDAASVELLNKAENMMIELMDYVLQGNSREAFFSKVHIFTPIGGQFWCEKVYEAIGAYISKQFDAEVKRVNARLNKHTHGYRTGKHSKGRK